MVDINNIAGLKTALLLGRASNSQPSIYHETVSGTVTDAIDSDTIELSEIGVALARAAAQSSLRIARIAEISGQIRDETFETPARIYGTVDRLLDVFG